jgi:hypothetical protein
MRIEIPEFADWKEEAKFWDRTDTTLLMEEEEGEWVGPGRIKPATGLCRCCGARMERYRLDVTIAHGHITLRGVEFYVCPHCGARTLPPDSQEFVAWSEGVPTPETTPA